jgi:hypothetical protein
VCAQLLLEQGASERAIELHAMMSRFPAYVNAGYVEDLVGRPIAAAAAAMSPDTVATAQARGRATDPAVAVAELMIELDVARFLPGPLGRLGRPLARLSRPVLALFLQRGA